MEERMNISNSETALLQKMDANSRKWVEGVIASRDFFAREATVENARLRRELVAAFETRDSLLARISCLQK